MPDLSIKIGKLKLKNPVMVASGTFGYAEEFKDLLNLKQLGAIVTKTITLKPRRGNPPPRTCETPAGMLNSIGLENPGIAAFLKEKLPFLKKTGVPIIMSIASEDEPGEFIELARRLDRVDSVVALELNISCPNIKVHGSEFIVQSQKQRTMNYEPRTKLISQDAEATYNLVKAVRRITKKTLITKLSPNVTDITEIALAAQDAGSDAVSLINTLTGMSVDVNKRKPKIAALTGGLSGPAIRPVAVRMVWEVYQKIKIPVIGMGGIIDVSSALEFFIAGSTAISVGTANFINPQVTAEIIRGLEKYLIQNKISDIRQIIGSLKIEN
jgi:dihydroorotate dehydrogenase (NAD+) catalytic subunit